VTSPTVEVRHSAYGAAHAPVPDRRRLALTWAVWLAVLAVVTLLMFTFRLQLDKVHVALGFLIVVLGASAAGGRLLGVALALAGFSLFNFLFLHPYFTFAVSNPLDWLVLLAFLITGVVAAQLLNRSQERAEIARQRAVEVERLAALGAETLNAGRAEDALHGIAEVIRSPAARCSSLTARLHSSPCSRAPGRAATTSARRAPT